MEAARDALWQHSNDFPRRKVEDLISDGSPVQSLPSGWIPGFSSVLRIEVEPVENLSEVEPNDLVLPTNYWRIVRRSEGDQIVFFADKVPESGKTYRIEYTTTHVESGPVVESAPALTALEERAVPYLAASILCEQLSGVTLQATTRSIPAEAVDFGTKPDGYLSLAQRFENRYRSMLRAGDRGDSSQVRPGTPKTATFARVNWDRTRADRLNLHDS